MSRRCNDIGDTLNRLSQYVIRNLESLKEGGGLIDYAQQPLIWNDKQCVNVPTHVPYTFFSMFVPSLPFILKWLRHHAHRENSHFTGNARDDRSSPCASPTAHSRSHKDHVCAFQALSDVVFAFQRCIPPNFRLRSRT